MTRQLTNITSERGGRTVAGKLINLGDGHNLQIPYPQFCFTKQENFINKLKEYLPPLLNDVMKLKMCLYFLIISCLFKEPKV